MQYNDSIGATHAGAATSSSIVSISGVSENVSASGVNNYALASNGISKMSNKFISGKLGVLYASAKGQPIRARTNLERHADVQPSIQSIG